MRTYFIRQSSAESKRGFLGLASGDGDEKTPPIERVLRILFFVGSPDRSGQDGQVLIQKRSVLVLRQDDKGSIILEYEAKLVHGQAVRCQRVDLAVIHRCPLGFSWSTSSSGEWWLPGQSYLGESFKKQPLKPEGAQSPHHSSPVQELCGEANALLGLRWGTG
ncbi:MAG: hypothetical protein QGD96_13775, partial [Anaerolineae bacterium]|nr:hypothetical protein [Anaerolineae bacterium]